MFHFNNHYGNSNNVQQSLQIGNPNDDDRIRVNISYKNYISEDKAAINRRKYGGDLLNQIEKNEMRKKLEKEKKRTEDLKEELRLVREREKIMEQAMKEEMKSNEELFKRKKDNERIISSYSVMSHPRAKRGLSSVIDWKEKKSNPFYDNIKRKQKELDEFNMEILDMLNNIQALHKKNVDAIDKEVDMIHFININSNEYKSKYIKEIENLKEEIHDKKSRDYTERLEMYKKYTDNLHRKKEMNEYLNINRFKLPAINYKINAPIVRAASYLDPHYIINVNQSYENDKYDLQKLLIKNSRKVDRLDHYEDK